MASTNVLRSLGARAAFAATCTKMSLKTPKFFDQTWQRQKDTPTHKLWFQPGWTSMFSVQQLLFGRFKLRFSRYNGYYDDYWVPSFLDRRLVPCTWHDDVVLLKLFVLTQGSAHLEAPPTVDHPTLTEEQLAVIKNLEPHDPLPSFVVLPPGTPLNVQIAFDDYLCSTPEWKYYQKKCAETISQLTKMKSEDSSPGFLISGWDGSGNASPIPSVPTTTCSATVQSATDVVKTTLKNIKTANQNDITSGCVALHTRVRAILRSPSLYSSLYVLAAEKKKSFTPQKSMTARIAHYLDTWLIKLPSKLVACIKGLLFGFEFITQAYNNTSAILEAIMNKVKPVALVAILSTYNHTPEGFVAVTTAILQLYGMLNLETLQAGWMVIWELFCTLLNAGRRILSGSWNWIRGNRPREDGTDSDASAHLEAPGDNIYRLICIAILGMIGLASVRIPHAKMQSIRTVVMSVVCVTSLIKGIGYICSLVSDYFHTNPVRAWYCELVELSEQVMDPNNISSAPRVREVKPKLQALEKEISKAQIDPSYSTHSATLRSMLSLIRTLSEAIADAELGAAARKNAPVMFVFSGKAGIGKTTLCMEISRRLGCDTPSFFNLLTDHHDLYTGEPVCLWDECDADPKGAFIETTIGIVNISPFHLNNDLIGNKRKIFSSSLILGTTNAETPVADTNPRADPWYRRVTIVDVDAPGLDWTYGAPTGFKDDLSHLTFKVRGYQAYNSKGDCLGGGKRIPTCMNFDMLMKHIISSLRRGGHFTQDQVQFPTTAAHLEGPSLDIPRNIVVVTPSASDWYSYFLERYQADVSFINVSLNTPAGHNPGHNLIFRTKRPTKISDDMIVVNAGPYKKPEGSVDDINTILGVKLPHKINHNFHQHLFKSSVHLNVRPPCGIPIYHTYTACNGGDFLRAFRSEYGETSWKLALKLLWSLRGWDPVSALEGLTTFAFPLDMHHFSIVTDKGTFYIYTSMGIQVFFDPLVTAEEQVQLPYSMPKWNNGTTGEQICSAVVSIWHAFTSVVPHLLTVQALTYYHSLWRGHVQAPSSTVARTYQGVALTDQEYSEWKEYNERVAPGTPISDYIAARNSLSSNTAAVSSRVAQIAQWISTRRPGPDFTAHLEAPGDVPSYVRPLIRSTGEHGGWACHLGSGIWLFARHTWREGMTVETHPVEPDDNHPLNARDLGVLRGPTIREQAAIANARPIVAWDGRNLNYVISYHGRIEGVDISGYSALLMNGSTRGDCGLPYLDAQGHIVAIHSARFDSSSQVIMSAVTVTPKPAQQTWRCIPVAHSSLNMGPLSKGTAYGRSKAHPEMYEWERHEPAVYGGPDPRRGPTQEKILAAALVPYVSQPEGDMSELEVAARYVSTYFSELLSFVPKARQETLHEALRRLDLNTSCGPFVPGVKRDHLWEFEGEMHYEPNSAFGVHISNCVSTAQAGLTLHHAYKLALKDELISIPKCRQKRRLLWGCDVGLTVVCAMVLGQVFDRLKSIVDFSPCAVGCNPDTTYIAILADRFRHTQPLCLDYSKWDSTMNTKVISAAVNILCDMCEQTPMTECVRKTLSVPPVGYFMNMQVTAVRGLPSGMPGTSIVNSICHCLLYTMAVWRTCDMSGIARERDPLRSCPMVCYGDDCIYGFNGRMAANLDRFVGALKSLGLKPTMPDKSAEIRFTNEMVFLKRTIIAKDRMVIGALDLSSIIRQAVWCKGSTSLPHTEVKPPSGDRMNQIQEALIALSAHPKAVYEEWVDLFRETVSGEGLWGVQTDYELNWQNYQSRYWTGNIQANAYLELQYQGSRKAHLEAPEDDKSAESSSGIPSGDPNVTGSGTAPGVDLGTAGAPSGQSLPLASLGVQQQSGVPLELYTLWVQGTRIAWNTRQPTGTRLGVFQLHPRVHPYLEHLIHMYAGWSGSMMCRILISGSGIYGGRLTAAVIPPGIPIDSVNNPTAYECAILDARTTSSIQITLPDVRLTTYHQSESAPETSVLGIWVNAPLLNPYTSGGNASAAEVSIYWCPGPDFAFCLLREPTGATNGGPGGAHYFSRILPATTRQLRGNRTGTFVINLTANASFAQNWNHFDSSGTTRGWGVGMTSGNLAFTIELARTSGQTPNVTTFAKVRPVDWDGTGLDPNTMWPHNLPDWICSTGFSPSSEWPSPHQTPHFRGLIGSGYLGDSASGGGVDVDELSGGRGFMVIHGRLNTTSNSGTLIDPAPTTNVRDLWIWISGAQVPSAANRWILFNNSGIHSTSQGRNAPLSTILVDGSDRFFPSGPNNICTFGSMVPGTYPSSGLIPSSQPQDTSLGWARGELPQIPPGQMAIFNLTSEVDSFELGVRSDGVFLMGGNHVVDLTNTEYTITFQTVSPLSTVLQPPGGHGNESRFRRRR